MKTPIEPLAPSRSSARGSITSLIASFMAFLAAGCLPEPAPNPQGPAGEQNRTGSGGSSGQPSGDQGNGAAAGAPMPATAFAFGKHLKRGDTEIVHLYGYDLATGKEWLISDFEEASSTTPPWMNECMISADRKSIVFSSSRFRPTAEELQLHRNSYWQLSLGNKSYQRLTPFLHLKEWWLDKDGKPPGKETALYMGGGTLIADGTVFFTAQIFYNTSSNPTGVMVMHMMGAARAGNFTSFTAFPCRYNFATGPSRDGQGVLAFRQYCGNGVESGLYEMKGTPLAQGELLVPANPPSDQPGEKWSLANWNRHRWLKDGSALLLTVWPDKGPKSRLVRTTPGSGVYKTLFTPEKTTESVEGVEIGPNGDVLLSVTEELSKDKSVSHHFVFDPETGATKPLPLEDTVAGVCF